MADLIDNVVASGKNAFGSNGATFEDDHGSDGEGVRDIDMREGEDRLSGGEELTDPPNTDRRSPTWDIEVRFTPVFAYQN